MFAYAIAFSHLFVWSIKYRNLFTRCFLAVFISMRIIPSPPYPQHWTMSKYYLSTARVEAIAYMQPSMFLKFLIKILDWVHLHPTSTLVIKPSMHINQENVSRIHTGCMCLFTAWCFREIVRKTNYHEQVDLLPVILRYSSVQVSWTY